ncbi:hypothetical protein cand_037640 [Cryptosporidium andersoni]|uniref:Uncharacterized protein n=1 Tax=Cryptosporidium andersoni TaxID=117008 RepID=A0A1J4MXZ0_9CRYT|nr:hypothetical protein cand_037640 [Cryptosporidium andersoni]
MKKRNFTRRSENVSSTENLGAVSSYKVVDISSLDIEKVASSLPIPTALSKLISISKQLQYEIKNIKNERDEAYNALIIQRDYYEHSGKEDISKLKTIANTISNIEHNAKMNNLRKEYEKQMDEMELNFQNEKKILRNKVLHDVEDYLIKYRDLAVLATEELKRQKEKMEAMKIRAKQLAETTCLAFEEKLKRQMKESIRKYEEMAQATCSRVLEKEKNMDIQWNEREKCLEREKKEFEKSILKESEKRIEEFRRGYIETQVQLAKEREIFDDIIDKLKEKIARECDDFESEIQHRFAVAFNIDEDEVQRRLSNYSEALKKSQLKAQEAKD